MVAFIDKIKIALHTAPINHVSDLFLLFIRVFVSAVPHTTNKNCWCAWEEYFSATHSTRMSRNSLQLNSDCGSINCPLEYSQRPQDLILMAPVSHEA